MNLDEALVRWESESPRYRRAAERTAVAVNEIAAGLGLTITTTAREKDLSSYRGKVIVKGYEDAWGEVTDKAGARAIVSTPTDVDRLLSAILASQLQVVDVEDKRNPENPDSLGYSGVHVQVVAPPEDGDLEPIECEIQIRTSAQDVWSVVSHKLLYKPVVDLPKADQHAIYRLVALIELFDQEVERVSERLRTVPGYELREILEVAEGEFQRLAQAASYRELSVRILDALRSVIPTEGDYGPQLRQWVTDHEDGLRDAIATYGPKSELARVYAYALFSQPEFFVVLERLDAVPSATEHAWRDAELPLEWLRAIATYSTAEVGD